MKLLRIVLHALYAIGLLLIVSFSGNQYDWMSEMDPTIPANAIEDGSGNSAVFVGAVLLIIVMTQLFLALNVKNKWEKAGSGVLILLALLVWLIRAN